MVSVKLALEAYSEFTNIMYDTEMLNKFISISGISENILRDIEKLHSDFKTNYGTIKKEILKLRDEFYQSHGLYRLTPDYFENYSNTERDMDGWITPPAGEPLIW